MSEFSISITLGLVLASTGLLGALLFFSKFKPSKKIIFYIVSASAGFLLATIFSEMLPLVSEDKLFVFYVLAGYLVLHFFTFVFTNYFEVESGITRKEISKNDAWLIFLSLIVITFIEGLALGSSFYFSKLLGFAVFFAIILKKIPEGLTIVSVMANTGRNKIGSLSPALILGLSTVSGVFWASTFTLFANIVLAISLGAFIQIVTTDLIPKMSKKNGLINFLIIIAGVLLYYVFKIALINLGII